MKAVGEFILASFTDVARDINPHVGCENDGLQCRVTAEFAGRLEIPSANSGKPYIGYTVDVDDPGKLRPDTC